MNILIPSLPSVRHLPFYCTIDVLTGYVWGKLSQTNPNLIAAIFLIRALANTFFYQLANFVLKGKGLQAQKIFLATSMGVNLTFLVALRELNLIGSIFSLLLGLAIIGQLLHRVCYIQDEEKRLEVGVNNL